MLYDKVLTGTNVSLRMLELSDCNETYLNWMNNSEVNKYLESRWSEHSIESIKEFVSSVRNSSNNYMFAIIFEGRHVGNIKVGPIHPIYKNSFIGLMIGDKTAWGKGVATEAINLVCDFCFNVLNLNKVLAGVFEQNISSQRAFEKNNFKREAVFRKQAFVNSEDSYCDIYNYGLLREEFNKRR